LLVDVFFHHVIPSVRRVCLSPRCTRSPRSVVTLGDIEQRVREAHASSLRLWAAPLIGGGPCLDSIVHSTTRVISDIVHHTCSADFEIVHTLIACVAALPSE